MSAALVLLLALLASPAGASSSYLWEGFEREVNWEAGDGAATVDRQVGDEETTEGGRSLKILFLSSAPSAWADATREEDMDWSPYGAVVFDIWVPEGLPGARASIVISTGDKLRHEAFLPALQPGWNRGVRIDLLTAAFLSAASNYRPTGWLVGRSDVTRVTIRFYPGAAATGAVFVDNIRLERTGLIVIGDLAVNPVAEVTASGVHLGYVPPDLRLRRRDFAPIQSFDDELPWTPPDETVTIEPEPGLTSYGRRGLAVRFPPSPEGFDLVLAGIEGKLAGNRLFRLEIYDPGGPASVSLRLEDGDGNEYESSRKSLKHGWNSVVWDFSNREAWHGGVMEPGVLERLSAVYLNVASSTAGRLVFDGAAVGSVRIASAARASARFRTSYHPSPDFEVVLTPRVEDTWYGNSLPDTRSAGAEAWLDSGRVRADLGGFRTGVLYRSQVTAFDNPMNALVSPDNLGSEVAAVETQGRIGDTEVQALAASRLEYRRYNSHLPTGFGPEALLGLRARHDAGSGIRLGATFLDHAARYEDAVSGIPRRRHTAGLDAEGSMASGSFALGASLEAAMTGGDRFVTTAVVPDNDRYYMGASLSPSWGRLELSGGYTLLGYDFDAGFTEKGGNSEMFSGSARLQLEGLPVVSALEAVPFTGRTLARNLALGVSGWRYETRDRYEDPDTGKLVPMSGGYEVEASLANNYESTPNFGVKVAMKEEDNPWTRTPGIENVLSMRVPLPAGLVLNLLGETASYRTFDKGSDESGKSWARGAEVGLECHFPTNLVVSVTFEIERSREGWEGEWGDPVDNEKWKASARQPLGASTVVQVDYGVAPLYGSDYGAQGTIDVVTVYVKSSF